MAPWPSNLTTYYRRFGAFFIFVGGLRPPKPPLHVGGKPPIPPKVKDWMLQCPMASEKDIFQWIYGGLKHFFGTPCRFNAMNQC